MHHAIPVVWCFSFIRIGVSNLKLSKNTLNVLKNFSNINTQLLFRPGNVIRTQSPTAFDILATARVEETFPCTAGIHDLPRFIGALSLFNDPELKFGEDQLVISEGKRTLNYTYAAESMIKAVPVDADLDIEPIISFELTSEDFSSTIKSIGVLKCAQLAFIGDGEDIIMRGVNLDDPTSDYYDLTVGKTDRHFKFYLFKDNLKLMPADYMVSLSTDCIEFKSKSITYHLAYHSSSDTGDLY
jgi:hypothetical protein